MEVPCPHIILVCVMLTNNEEAEACEEFLWQRGPPAERVLCVGVRLEAGGCLCWDIGRALRADS